MSRSLLKRLQTMAPAIPWTTPVPSRVYGDSPNHQTVGFLCRICVAELGFKARQDADRLFATEERCLQHIADAHVGAGPARPPPRQQET